MAQGRPVKAKQRALVVKLHGEGLGRNQIARETGVSAATVTAIAQQAGLEFNWEATELATRARSIQTAAIREGLAQAALLRAHEALEAMSDSALITHFETGALETRLDGSTKYRPGKFREHVLDAPTFADQRNLATVVGILVSKFGELTRQIPGTVDPAAVSTITDLSEALAVAAAALGATDPSSDPTAEPVAVSREAMIALLEAQTDDGDA